MESIKRLEDSLHRRIEEEIRKRDDVISELREKLRTAGNNDTGTPARDTDKYKGQLREKNKEIETLNAKLDSYIKLLEERTISETKNVATKKVAISAEPITLRHSQALNFVLSKVPKTVR